MTLSDYHERRTERIERFKEIAEKNHNLSNQVLDQAHKMADVIPFGQPILVGHYSEKRDRNYRDRIMNKYEKAGELEDKAKYYARRAATTESNPAISSDDPDAIEALKEKLQNLKDSHDLMVKGNKIVKSKKLTTEQKIDALNDLGIDEEKLLPDCMGNIGFPGYALTNSSANIRRIEQRIKDLEKQRTDQTKEWQIGNIDIVDSVEENRIMITFPGIPDEPIRNNLKSNGFRWSPKNGAWQAYRSAAWKIPDIIKMLSVMPAYVNPENYLFTEVI